jgi:Cu(I)/Ag(I) efflux system periplasmic protein CusF
MNTTSLRILLACACLIASAGAFAADQAASAAPQATAAATELTDGEIRRIDAANKKITIKHAEIKNISMPAMTMVFQVRDAAALGTVKVGDKVKFAAEKVNGALVVTQLQPAQ